MCIRDMGCYTKRAQRRGGALGSEGRQCRHLEHLRGARVLKDLPTEQEGAVRGMLRSCGGKKIAEQRWLTVAGISTSKGSDKWSAMPSYRRVARVEKTTDWG
jgi:hypothetical protein